MLIDRYFMGFFLPVVHAVTLQMVVAQRLIAMEQEKKKYYYQGVLEGLYLFIYLFRMHLFLLTVKVIKSRETP